jgi:hypothetical protein
MVDRVSVVPVAQTRMGGLPTEKMFGELFGHTRKGLAPFPLATPSMEAVSLR